ncbi:MAG: dienelactone hydrolase family protein [Planctomycetes bacterium]|nr:dienelactone hydrolase family protein [Planctomycetota bacterium]
MRSIVLILLGSSICAQTPGDPLKALEAWLARPVAERPALADQAFAKVALTRVKAEKGRDLLIADLERRLREEREEEWKKREIRIGELTMPFEYGVFGEAAPGKRSLFISMHGGGSAPKSVNDQQWRNQIKLYEPKEGLYLAPRAPTDTWDMWHQAHIDAFFLRLIEDAVLFAGVDVDRVYLMGYSAGGDGVFQLAPRMADRFAAAAMMAGHPNETRPLGLRNLPFTLHMGANDAAFKRNEVAATWKEELAKLRAADAGGYDHEVVIHAGKGHWMDREDRVALPWMAKFKRRRRPDRVVWLQDDVLHDRFYWLGMPGSARQAGNLAAVRISGQRIIVEEKTTAPSLTIYLDDSLVDLDRPVTLVRPGHPDREQLLPRSLATIAMTLGPDPASVFVAQLALTAE